MASIDPTLISDPEEHKWVVEISEILDHQLKINGETPFVSVFQVPETIITKKPEAYEPQHIGLGPFHHFRPGPYKKMEQLKLAVVRKVLEDCEIEDGKDILLDRIRKLVPKVRSCYEMFLQDDDESLAWIFAIDGVFLFNLFQTYNIGMGEKEEYLPFLLRTDGVASVTDMKESDEVCESSSEGSLRAHESSSMLRRLGSPTVLAPESSSQKDVVTTKNRTNVEKDLGLPHHRFHLPKFGTKRRKLVQDIMMVGNQIPFMVLKEIYKGLHPSASGSFLLYGFRTFCNIHSPLKLCPESQAPTNNVEHVLDYMYYSILNNYPSHTPHYARPEKKEKKEKKKEKKDEKKEKKKEKKDEKKDDCSSNIIEFASKVPKKEIVQAFEKTVSILETFTQSKILIPSASKLRDKAGFKFNVLQKHKGIQNIYKNDKDIYLPCVTLNIDSEVILRNLVAYETLTASPDKFPLTEYMGLMCALIVNVDDVKYLRDQKVIYGDMGNDEVAKLFIGMSTSIQPIKTKEKSDLRKMIDEVNTVYNVRLEMKMYLLLKKLARWLLVGLKAIGKFVEDSWKIVAFMISIVTVVMLTYQAYCDVYGCDKKAVTLLPYASS